jgi:hypothetical protein
MATRTQRKKLRSTKKRLFAKDQPNQVYEPIIDNDDDLVHLSKKKKKRGHYGAFSSELAQYLEDAKLGDNVRCMDPDKLYGAAKLKIKISCSGMLLIPCNPGGGHWITVCVDFDTQVYGIMGDRKLPIAVKKFVSMHADEESMVDLEKFTDISPRGIGSQIESECGARAAVYCAWFGKARDRRITGGHHQLDPRRFRCDVADLMAAWRSVR